MKLLIEPDPEDLKDSQDIGGIKGRPAPSMSTSLQEIEEMKKSRPVVKNMLNEWHDWLVD